MREMIHGHEVMSMMLDSGKSYTRESLAHDIKEKFGADARFYTCSAEDLSADELVAFLEAKGKFIQGDGGFQTSADRMCKH